MDSQALEVIPSPDRRRGPKVIVITGASAGVGRAAARRFAARGDRVALLARGEGGLDGASNDVEAAGGMAMALTVDVADSSAVEQAAGLVERELGCIDVWVNDAMVSVFSPFKDMTAEEFRRVTEVTYLGVVHGTMAALRRMLPRDRGHIVQVGSALAYRSIPLQSAYCGAKAGIRGFTDSVRCELLHDKSRVRITMVQMPALDTPQFGWSRSRMPRKAQPVPPIFEPDVAARAIVWAAEHDRREMWVGWPTVKAILFGAKLAPAIADRYLAHYGYEAQQTSEPRDPRRSDDLWKPVDEAEGTDRGARGTFGARSSSRSAMLWLSMHRFWVAAVVGAIGACALGSLWASSRGGRFARA
ncbi:MAG TPA: SDR family oxidoreductase [Polyangiaceae bacterium]